MHQRRNAADRIGRHTGLRFDGLGSEVPGIGCHRIETDGMVLHKGLVVPIVGDQQVSQTPGERAVGSGFRSDVNIGLAGNGRKSGVDNDQLRTALTTLHDHAGHGRVRCGGVGTPQDDATGVAEIGFWPTAIDQRVADLTSAKTQGIDRQVVRCAEGAAKPLGQILLLVKGGSLAFPHRHAVRAVAFLNIDDAFGNLIKRLLEVDLAPAGTGFF